MNFPELWLKTIIRTLTSLTSAPFLDGISELPVEVTTLGDGSASEINIIHIPKGMANVDVLINNTTYPLDVVQYEDGSVTLSLDKYQTKVISISDDQITGSSINKIEDATKTLTESLLIKKYRKAIHSIAPNADTAMTPSLPTTGATFEGRKKMTIADIVNMKRAFDKMDIPDGLERRLVLCADHVNDLLDQDQTFKDKFYSYSSGAVLDMFGFKIYSYNGMPKYTAAGVKIAFDAVTAGNQASVAFLVNNIAKKTGYTKQYYAAAGTVPTVQTNQLAYRHYFVCMPTEAKYIGAIYSAAA